MSRHFEKLRLFGIRYGSGKNAFENYRQLYGGLLWRRSTTWLVAAFAVSELAANWLAATFKIPLGPWLVPAGAFLIPLSLFMRDALQLRHPRKAVTIAFFLGAGISALFNYEMARIALASFAAFTVSFLTDTVVFTAMRNRPLPWRLRLSNWAALPVDTIVFVPIAFGGLYSLGAVIPGQLIAKLGMTEFALLLWWAYHRILIRGQLKRMRRDWERDEKYDGR